MLGNPPSLHNSDDVTITDLGCDMVTTITGADATIDFRLCDIAITCGNVGDGFLTGMIHE